MSRLARPARSRALGRLLSWLRRLPWRMVRGLMVLASAIGPGMPPPPPPPPPPTEQVDEDGEVRDET